MENAAKALLIAGGILLAILITGLLVMLAGNLTSYNEANANKEAAKQLAEFNKQYESYNKKLLYGTDVITLVNKAIENNKKMDIIKDTNSRYYVNVVIKLNKDVYSTETKINKVTNEKTVENIGEKSLQTGTYKLGNWQDSELAMNAIVVNFFNSPANSSTTSTDTITTIKEPGLIVFKKAIFKCEGIECLDGRVHEITFTEI